MSLNCKKLNRHIAALLLWYQAPSWCLSDNELEEFHCKAKFADSESAGGVAIEDRLSTSFSEETQRSKPQTSDIDVVFSHASALQHAFKQSSANQRTHSELTKFLKLSSEQLKSLCATPYFQSIVRKYSVDLDGNIVLTDDLP